ncbi:MAG: hypothetical protein ABIN25_07530 [Ginsengibacter sp.]
MIKQPCNSKVCFLLLILAPFYLEATSQPQSSFKKIKMMNGLQVKKPTPPIRDMNIVPYRNS